YHKLANPSRSIFTDMERQCYQHNVGNEPIMVRHQPCLFLSMLKVACLVLNLDLEISDWIKAPRTHCFIYNPVCI
ncbi:hypothetical protein B296_00022743, partial [Ensete ventricosum]